MHKGIMIISKSKNKKEALENTRKFLKEYENNVFDRYQIGGRWTCLLSPFLEKFDGFISQNEIDKKQVEFQKLWENIGGKGEHPYCNHYDLPKNGGYYDVSPLVECIDIVKEWQQTVKDAKEAEEQAKKWLSQKNPETGAIFKNLNMYGYGLKIAANLYQQKFSFDTNIFNIESWDYSIPEDVENYYVVMVDMHN